MSRLPNIMKLLMLLLTKKLKQKNDLLNNIPNHALSNGYVLT